MKHNNILTHLYSYTQMKYIGYINLSIVGYTKSLISQ